MYTVTQLLARESIQLFPLSWFLRTGIRVSHSKLVNRIIKINHAHNLHVKMLDFAPFTDLYLKNANCSQD